MKRQVHPPRALRSPWHSVRKRAGRVFAIAGRTELGRGLVDGRNNRSDCPLVISVLP
jgi:hypothetical protein